MYDLQIVYAVIGENFMEKYKEKAGIGLLLFIVILGVYLVFQVCKQQYTHLDVEMYIYDISEEEIVVKNFPQNISKFNGTYKIKLDDSFNMKDEKGNKVEVSSLKQGDIILFDYKGEKKPNPKEGAVLNGFPYNIYHIRLSDKEVNYKFWRIEFPK